MRYKIFIFLQIIIAANIYCQNEISHTLFLNENEPNNGIQIAQTDNGFLLGGKYFDSELNRWSCSYITLDSNGDLISVFTVKNDTVPFFVETNFVEKDGQYYLFSPFDNVIHILNYDNSLNTINIENRINQTASDFAIKSSLSSFQGDILLFGRTFLNDDRNLVSMKIIDNDISIKSYENIKGSTSSSLALEDGRYVLTRVTQDTSVNYQKNQTSLVFLDRDLNPIESETEEECNTEMTPNQGIIQDRNNNIWITGTNVEKHNELFYFHPVVSKFTNMGKLIFTKKIDSQLLDSNGWNKVNSIIETHTNDGVLVVGSEVKINTSTSIESVGTIKKLNYEGDLIWTKEFDFRSGTTTVRDELSQIIKTSDGGYAITGSSFDHFFESEGPWIQSIFIKIDSLDVTSTTNSMNEAKIASIFPNPATSNITVKRSDEFSFERIELHNTSGTIVYRSTLLPTTNEVSISTSQFSTGTYILNFISRKSVIVDSQKIQIL